MKRRADKQISQLDDGSNDADAEEDGGSGEFKRADESEISGRKIKGLPKRVRTAMPTPQPAPVANPTFAPASGVSPLSLSGGSFSGFKLSASSIAQGTEPSARQPEFSGFIPFASASTPIPTFGTNVSKPNSKASTSYEGSRDVEMDDSSKPALRRPGSPVWESPEKRRRFFEEPPETQHKLALYGLNQSFINHLGALVEADSDQDMRQTIDKVLAEYDQHRIVINNTFRDARKQEEGVLSTRDDTQTPAKQTVASGLPTIPAPPMGAFTFGGRVADSTVPSQLPPSSGSKPPPAVGGITLPSGGFTFAGKPTGPALSPVSSVGTVPTPTLSLSPAMAPPDAEPALPSDTVSTPFASAAASSGSPAASLPSESTKPIEVPLKLSAFAGGFSSKPRTSSPLASQPPISATLGLPGKGTTTPAGTPPSTKLPSKFGMAPQEGTTSANSQPSLFSKPAGSGVSPFGSFSSPSKPGGFPTLSFGGNVNPAAGFGFGSAKPLANTGFPFATSFASTSQPSTDSSERPDGALSASDEGDNGQKSSLLSVPTQEGSLAATGVMTPSSSFGLSHEGTPEPEGEGEENEVTIYEQRCKLHKAIAQPGVVTLDWRDLGVGWVRLKKDRDTGKRRVLFRQEGTGRVHMNFYVYPSMTPAIPQPKYVGFTGLEDAKPVLFRLRCKTTEDAESLRAAVLSEVEAVLADGLGLRETRKDSPVVEEVDTDKSATEDGAPPPLQHVPQVEELPGEDGSHVEEYTGHDEMDEHDDASYSGEEEDDEIQEVSPPRDPRGYSAEEEDEEGDEIDEEEEGDERDGPEVVELLDDEDED